MAVLTTRVLRPLTLGKLLDRSVMLYRRQFLTFTGIVALVLIPISVFQLIITVLSIPASVNVQTAGADPAYFASPAYPRDMFLLLSLTFVSLGVSIVSFVLLQGISAAALGRAVAGAFAGEPLGILEAYGAVTGKQWREILFAMLVSIAAIFGLGLFWVLVPCFGWLTGLGAIYFFSGGIVPLLSPIIVLEDKSFIQSMRRAWDLTRRRFWWVVGFVVVLYLFVQLVISGPTLLLSQGASLVLVDAGNLTQTTVLISVIQVVVVMLMSLVFQPLQMTAYIMMYLDLRVRTEALDLVIAIDRSEGSMELFSRAALPAQQGNLLTGGEIGNFALITVAFLMIFFVLYVGLVALILLLAPVLGLGAF